MADENKGEKSSENIFKIMDEVIYQLNKTKKLFIIMILSFMVIMPLAFIVSFAIFDPPFGQGNGPWMHNGPPHAFFPLRIIPAIIVVVWLGIGIRQWFVLSKWTKKYQKYKELQEKIDKKLADEQNDDEEKDSATN